MPAPAAQFFESPQALRAWLQRHHATAAELLVGFHKTHAIRAGRRGITWPQSVEEALCFGWIDGVRRSLDADRYVIRFTPRRVGSKWSAVNVRLMAELESAGRMTDAGLAAFAARKEPDSKGYKAQKKIGELDAARAAAFAKNKKAWAFFTAQPPGYQKKAAWWVMQAKQDATRDGRLARLIEHSAAARRLE